MSRKPVPIFRKPRDDTMRVRFGAFELGKRGARRFDWRDPYYLALALNWRWFLAAMLSLDLVVNVVFAGLYLIQRGSIANARPGVFSDAFFFSVETLATVGYGAMSPATFYGHAIATIELSCGLAFIALATGLTFVRFSRPKARLLYADKAVVATHRGRRTLMIRVGNGRLGPLTDAVARLGALVGEQMPEGQFYRLIQELKLLRPRLPIFALTWTIMHVLEDDSPLRDSDPDWMKAADVRLFLSIEARDPTLGASVHDTQDYSHTDVLFGVRYADAVSIDENGRTVADLDRISRLEPDAGAPDTTEAMDLESSTAAT